MKTARTTVNTGVFIPAYNEEQTIKEVIVRTMNLELPLDVYIIDDGSIDETEEIARGLKTKVIRHPINLGGGAAVKTAFAIANREDYRYVATLDADGQHDPSELPSLIETIEREKAGLVIGSRFLGNGETNMKLYRKLGIRFFSGLVSLIMGQRITDATSCFRIYDMKPLRKCFAKLHENQYYALETILKMNAMGEKIVEVPIRHIERMNGRSKKGSLKFGYNLLRVIFEFIFQ